MFRTVSNGQSIHQYIPPDLRRMFYKNPAAVHASQGGKDPYGFFTNGLVLYLPLWALKGDSFKSVDAYRHTCSVTDTSWLPNGRDFDGLTSYINAGSGSSIDNLFTGGGTAIAWLNPGSDGGTNFGRIFEKRDPGWLFHVSSEAGGKVKVTLYIDFDDTDGSWITTATVIDIGAWSMLSLSYDNGAVGNNPTFYVNTTALTVGDGLTESSTPVGTVVSEAARDLIIGEAFDLTATFDGKMGGVFFYNRILSAGEIAHIYNCTKWRY